MSIAQHFPGYTAIVLWRLTWADWIHIADAADKFDEELRQQRAKSKTRTR